MSEPGTVLRIAGLDTLKRIVSLARTVRALSSDCRALAIQLGKPTVREVVGRLCNVVEQAGTPEGWLDQLDDLGDLLASAEYCMRSCQPGVMAANPDILREQNLERRLKQLHAHVGGFAWRDTARELERLEERMHDLREQVKRDVSTGLQRSPSMPNQGLHAQDQFLTCRRAPYDNHDVVSLLAQQYDAPPVVPPHVRDTVFQHADSLVPHLATCLDDRPLLCIAGLPGIGKTTLAKAIKETVREKFDASVILTVGRNRDVKQVLQQAWSELLPQVCSIPDDPAGFLVHNLAAKLGRRKVLVVFDDVWPQHSVALLNFARLHGHEDHQHGNRVIVTTRDPSILQDGQPGEEWLVALPSALGHTHARRLLCCHAFPGRTCPAEYTQVVEELLVKARGLPLMLELLGRDLKDKPIQVWRSRLQELGSVDAEDGEAVERIRDMVEPSIAALPPLLRRCFTVFGAFPQGHQIKPDALLQIFSGICPFRSSRPSTALAWAQQQLFLLVAKQLIAPIQSSWSGTRFVMHDVLWDVACVEAQSCPGIYLFSHCPQGSDAPIHGLGRIVIHADTQTAEMVLQKPTMNQCARAQVLLCTNPNLVWEQSGSSESMQELGQSLSHLQYMFIQGAPFNSLPAVVGQYLLLETLELLDCLQLTHLPDSLGSLHCLQRLTLGGCPCLTALPNSIGQLSHLQHLGLRGCSALSALPPTIGNLSRLLYLGLEKCRGLTALPATIGQLSRLTHLEMTSCSVLTELPPSMGQLLKLQELMLWDCSSLTELPTTLGCLSELRRLGLGGCSGLTALPPTVGDLTQMTRLGLGGCSGLRELPDTIGQLSQLQHLGLRGCARISALPTTIGSLSRLQYLGLGKCSGLATLPGTIGQLSHLQHLEMNYCCILTELPNAIGQLSHLQELMLWDFSCLTELPTTIGLLSELLRFELKGCPGLTTLPSAVGGLTRLQRLVLGGCLGLKALPDTIGQLSHLRHLALSGCARLGTLPTTIGKLTRLQYLGLGRCSSLATLPATIGQLLHLQHLEMKDCCVLAELPATTGRLLKLQYLELSGCKRLNELPASLCDLTALTTLNCRNCGAIRKSPVLMELRNLPKLKCLLGR